MDDARLAYVPQRQIGCEDGVQGSSLVGIIGADVTYQISSAND